ncbi:hypothetical protein E7T09_06410 [Deinococcus sp. KSM4-11]|uniref:3D domain-containing protein n=1 Tax=Deinococcus sp. KSM4-11 TaxID=2568654 RepID=UPI0010A352C3|nr:hypothetical protein [Deinococcus sp. KSM4-11]THF88802.1 hypothetical protein E7T09_06410 [Deinococcus sp. KSM4-11]
MAHAFLRWMTTIALAVTGIATAGAPALPDSTIAAAAVQDALSTPSTIQSTDAAQVRADTVAQAAASDTVAYSPIRGKVAIVRATAYNSVPGQTDATPFITATGTRTRPGVVALSRDLLRLFPYGTKVMIEDLSGRYSAQFSGRVFIVEDTMAVRKTNSLDIWMSTRGDAMRFGARQVRITAVR